MKKTFHIPYILFLAMVVLTSACKDYLDVNTDPNKPTKVTPSSLLSTTTYQTSQNYASAAGITSYYVQHLASPSGSTTDQQYPIDMSGLWSSLYGNLENLKDMNNFALQEGSTDYAGISKILTAMNLGIATDIWGDVPYSQALLGVASLTPTYDAQESIYAQIGQLLDEGVATLQQGNSTHAPGSDDFIHGGNIAAWIKTAYALKARYLNHLSKKASYDPNAVLTALSTAYTSNADDAQGNFYSTQVFNPWALIVQSNNNGILGGYLSQQIVNTMNGTNYPVFDPRLEFMTDSLPNGSYQGSINGKGDSKPYCILTFNTYYAKINAPVLLVTNAEMRFIEAEAAFRVDKNRAYQAYLAGIKAHMDKLGVDSTARNKYLANPAVSVGAANLTLDLIFKEKYIAMFLNPEAWVDARRYDYQYKNFTPPVNLNPDLNGQLIRRLNYPSSELQRNGANVPANGANLTNHVWWDQP